jgi:hypothetical protein
MNLVAAGRLACRGGWCPASRKNPSEVDLASMWRRLPVPPGKMPGSKAGGGPPLRRAVRIVTPEATPSAGRR